jgi:LPS sulfotransferase NodH
MQLSMAGGDEVSEADFGFLMHERFDFAAAAPVRKFYIIASAERSGSTYLCLKLWQTGALGAPWEYLNYQTEMVAMARRLQTNDVNDYLRQVVACRTSANGTFAIKAHYHHFSYVLDRYPQLLDALPPPHFIVMQRHDRLGQAISLARAIQTNAWSSFARASSEPVYDAALISQCLRKVEMQTAGWAGWLNEHRIVPLTIDYDELVERPDHSVGAARRFLGLAEPGEAPSLPVPMVERQADEVNAEWRARYLVEALIA